MMGGQLKNTISCMYTYLSGPTQFTGTLSDAWSMPFRSLQSTSLRWWHLFCQLQSERKSGRLWQRHELDLNNFNEALISIDLENVGEESEDDDTDFTPGDALGKALALVKQVLFSHVA
jgi:hypothetical protein